MRSLRALFLIAALFPAVAFAQSAPARAGITPESPLYFFDRLGESVAELFAFTPAARARLQLSFAAERIAEIETMLAEKGAAARGIAVAEAALAEHFAEGIAIAARERRTHDDAAAQAIDDGIRREQEAYAQVYEDHAHMLTEKEKELHDAAETADTAEERDALEHALEQVKEERAMTGAKIGEHADEREQQKKDDAAGGGREEATSTESMFGKHSDMNGSERERLLRSIESVEDEIKRTEEFLKQKKGDH